MTSPKIRLKKRLRGITENLTRKVELDYREKGVVRISPTGTSEADVPDYETGEQRIQKVELDLTELRERDEITEIAQWLYESGDGYRPNTEDTHSGYEHSYLPYPDEDNGEKRDEIIDTYVDDIAKFVNEVLAYAGTPEGLITEFSIPEDAFENAFDDFFGWLYEEEISAVVVVPLLNFDGDFDAIELNSEVEFFTQKSHKPENIANHLMCVEEKVENLEISKLTEAELGAVFGTKPRRQWFPIPSHKIRFRQTGPGIHPGAVEDIAQSVITAIRLFQPDGNLGIDNGCKLERGWKFYRTGVYDNTTRFGCRYLPEPLTFSAYSRSQKSGTVRGLIEKIEFSEGDAKDFRDFWNQYSTAISEAQRGGEFEVPLHRFNLIYQRNRFDDQVIDSVITAESTLGRDVNANERVIFAARAAYLLQDSYNPSYVYNLLDTIYDARVDVVHKGDEVGSRTVEYVENGDVREKQLEGRELIIATCEVMSEVICQYLLRYLSGHNITQTNQELNKEITQFLTQNPSVLAHLLDNSLSIGSLITE